MVLPRAYAIPAYTNNNNDSNTFVCARANYVRNIPKKNKNTCVCSANITTVVHTYETLWDFIFITCFILQLQNVTATIAYNKRLDVYKIH